jgi:hypothetical protein
MCASTVHQSWKRRRKKSSVMPKEWGVIWCNSVYRIRRFLFIYFIFSLMIPTRYHGEKLIKKRDKAFIKQNGCPFHGRKIPLDNGPSRYTTNFVPMLYGKGDSAWVVKTSKSISSHTPYLGVDHCLPHPT